MMLLIISEFHRTRVCMTLLRSLLRRGGHPSPSRCSLVFIETKLRTLLRLKHICAASLHLKISAYRRNILCVIVVAVVSGVLAALFGAFD